MTSRQKWFWGVAFVALACLAAWGQGTIPPLAVAFHNLQPTSASIGVITLAAFQPIQGEELLPPNDTAHSS
jgi:hypothetical protein